MISLEEALRRIDEAVKPLPPRRVSLLEAVGCCIAEEVVSKFDVPNFASSAMDGIAVRHTDLANKSTPTVLKVQGTIPAGKPSDEPLRPEHAFRIMTGAPLPPRADTVIEVEELEFEGDCVRISRSFSSGRHVRPVGNDIKAGEVIFPVGYSLRAMDVGICASLGLREVTVHPHPSVAVFATGSEIRPPGEELQPGQIYNSNDTTLRSLIAAFGLPDPGELAPVKDDPADLRPVLQRLCSQYDVVITSGAVSAGEFDYIPNVVKQLGGDLLFHKVAVKPGKPTLMARIGECWLLALPGNPVSVVVTFHLYGKRLLARLMGHSDSPVRERARLTEPFEVGESRFQVVGAYLKREEAELLARPVKRYSSGRLSSIRGIDGFIFVPGGTRRVEAGTEVDVEWM